MEFESIKFRCHEMGEACAGYGKGGKRIHLIGTPEGFEVGERIMQLCNN